MLNTDQLLIQIKNLLHENPDLTEIAETSLSGIIENLKTRENSLELKAIAELEGRNFFVDSYQRGYKWKPQQVEALLNDIDEFEPKDENEFYCLQPVVVKRKPIQHEGKESVFWELIDGQQRMTTIFIILSHLLNKPYFTLRYETRQESSQFLNDLVQLNYTEQAPKFSHIDNHYFYQAYKTVHDWFATKSQEKKDIWRDKLLHKTKVIWYMVRSDHNKDSQQHSIEIFTRLNQGKIALTDAELIKALFLQSVMKAYHHPEIAKQKQFEMASQWDLIEQTLQDDEFWAFLSPHKGTNKHTRIELIFDLLADESKDKQQLNHKTFLYFANQLKNASSYQIEEQWTKVLQGFHRLTEWFKEDQLYHLIGFIIGQKIKTINILWQESKDAKRDQFVQILKSHIQRDYLERLFKVDKDSTRLGFSKVDYLSPSQRPKIIGLLMLFNIYINEKHKTRFSFRAYNNCQWDIEHIHAQQSLDLPSDAQREIWLNEQKAILDAVPESYKGLLDTKLTAYQQALAVEPSDTESLKKEYLEELSKIVGDVKEAIQTLDNLCLLPASVNRSIGNQIFLTKRQRIVDFENKGKFEKEHQGKFIPLATQQVFSKYFSDDVSQMYKWDEIDRSNYKAQWLECFKGYGLDFGGKA